MFNKSRYANTPKIEYKGKTMYARRELKKYRTEYTHLVKEGDTLDKISHLYYNSANYWWVILQANNYMLESEIRNGETLKIPPIDDILVYKDMYRNEGM